MCVSTDFSEDDANIQTERCDSMLPGMAMMMWKQWRVVVCIDDQVILLGIVGAVEERSFSSNLQAC